MNVLSFTGRAGAAWMIALAAGFVASRIPAFGLLLGALGWGYALWRRRLPPTALVAASGAVLLAAVLPWAALAQDPFQALPASAAWPVASVAWAALGAGAATWTQLGRPLASESTRARVLASPLVRRALLVELGALALLLPVSIAGTQVTLGAAAATLLFAYAQGARPRLVTALDLPVAALVAAAAISAALSATPTSPLEVTALRTLLAFYVVTRALAVTNPSDRELGRLILAWAGVSALASAMAFAQHWSGFDAVAALGLRLPVHVPAPESPGHLAGIGAFASRLTFAHATLVTVATLLGLQLAGAAGGKRKAWLWAAVALEIAGLWSTFARAAWFALVAIAAAAAGLAGGMGERARVIPRALRGLALVAAAVGLVLVLSPGVRAWGRAGLRPSDNHDRLFLWARAAQIAIDHPVLGVGFGSYHLVLGPYYDRFNPKFRMRTWAHDMPLSMLCETGPLGLFAFLWLLVEALALAIVALRRPGGEPTWRGLALGGALATLGFAVVSAFHDALYDGQVGYNLFFSLGLAAWAAVQLAQNPEIVHPTALH